MNKKFYLIFSNIFLVLLMLSFISIDTFGQSVKIKASPDSTLCVGQTLTLTRMYTPEVGDTNTTFTVYYKGSTPLDTANSFMKNSIVLTDAGKYRVKVFDIHGLEAEDSINIKVNKIPTYTSITKKDPSTCGGMDGYFVLHGLEKNKSYTLNYKLNGVDQLSFTTNTLNGDTLKKENLKAGIYTKIKIQLNGCSSNSAIDTIVLNDPPAPIDVTINLMPEMCFGETIAITKGRPGGKVSIVDGFGVIIGNDEYLTTNNNSNNRIIVKFEFTDPVTKCSSEDRDTVIINKLPIINTVVDSVKCFGSTNGSILIPIIPNNNNPIIYKWSNSNETDNLRENLKAGEYSVTVMDSKGCSKSIENIEVKEPSILKLNNVQDRVICYNKPVTDEIEVSGGTKYYLYNWVGPAGLMGDTKVINYDNPGKYLVTVTDFNQCIETAEINLIENKEILISINAEKPNNIPNHFCAGQSITLTASGAQELTWANAAINEPITVNVMNSYIVMGKTTENGKSCTVFDTIETSMDTLPKITFDELNQQTKNNFLFCKSDSLVISVIKNNSGYSYLWEDILLNDSKRIIKTPGNYPIKVTDIKTGCVSNDILKADYLTTKEIQISKPSGTAGYLDTTYICENTSELEFRTNGSLTDFDFVKWSIKSPGNSIILTDVFLKTSIVKVNKSSFTLYLEGKDNIKGCYTADSIYFQIREAETNIFETPICGIVQLRQNYSLTENIPSNVLDLGNGFYYIDGSVQLEYNLKDEFKSVCTYTMNKSYVNEDSGQTIIKDNLIYDECGPFLLAKYKSNFCYTWYQISKKDSSSFIVPGKDSSWFKEPDLELYTYVAVGYDCSHNCDTTQISTRSSGGGKTIPCYNSGESTIKIYPNPNQGHMYLKMEGLPAGKQEVFIYDMMGRQVFKKTIDHTGNNDITELSLTQLPDGIYFAKTYYNRTGISTKFIITH